MEGLRGTFQDRLVIAPGYALLAAGQRQFPSGVLLFTGIITGLPSTYTSVRPSASPCAKPAANPFSYPLRNAERSRFRSDARLALRDRSFLRFRCAEMAALASCFIGFHPPASPLPVPFRFRLRKYRLQ